MKCPDWMAAQLEEAGGIIKFSEFMNLALNDPINGSYASGKLKIGVKGDFVTSPSLGKEFSELLGVQIVQWILDLEKQLPSQNIISLVEIGPGEGDLAFNLIKFIQENHPRFIKKIELILVEINESMKEKQKIKLASITDLTIKWDSLENLAINPLTGIFLAHEVLDTLPVDVLICDKKNIFLQGVELIKHNNHNFIRYTKLPLPQNIKDKLSYLYNSLNISIPPNNIPDLWKTELHTSINPWFKKLSSCIKVGSLLVIDYALEASQYYKTTRSEGTLLSYKNQTAFTNILEDVGYRDITAHLCLETLISEAISNKFVFVGETKQGLSLLSLGLSSKIDLLKTNKSCDLAKTLRSRENLLRLVDPIALGDFRWILFKKNIDFLSTKFLEEPKQ